MTGGGGGVKTHQRDRCGSGNASAGEWDVSAPPAADEQSVQRVSHRDACRDQPTGLCPPSQDGETGGGEPRQENSN